MFSDRSLKAMIIIGIIAVLANIAFWFGIAYIILHFVLKYW